jgi:hypothetical protein
MRAVRTRACCQRRYWPQRLPGPWKETRAGLFRVAREILYFPAVLALASPSHRIFLVTARSVEIHVSSVHFGGHSERSSKSIKLGARHLLCRVPLDGFSGKTGPPGGWV